MPVFWIFLIAFGLLAVGIITLYLSYQTEKNKTEQRNVLIEQEKAKTSVLTEVESHTKAIRTHLGALQQSSDPLNLWATNMLSEDGAAILLPQLYPLLSHKDYTSLVLLPLFAVKMEKEGYTLLGDAASAPKYGRPETIFAFEGEEGRIVVKFEDVAVELTENVLDPSGKLELNVWTEEAGPYKDRLYCGRGVVLFSDQNCDGTCRVNNYIDVEKAIQASLIQVNNPISETSFSAYRPKQTQVGIVFERISLAAKTLPESALKLSYTNTTIAGKQFPIAEAIAKMVEAACSLSQRMNAIIAGFPGTGKTQLARLWAQLLCAKGAEVILTEDQGTSLTSIIEELRTRTTKSPLVWFIEDIQAFPTTDLTALTSFMDGASSKVEISVVALYNPAEADAEKQVIIEALCRPGRVFANINCVPISKEQGQQLVNELKALLPDLEQVTELPDREVTLAEVWQCLSDKRLRTLFQ